MIQQASTKGIQKNDIYTTFKRYLHFRQDHKLQFFMCWTIYKHLEGYEIIYNKHLFYKDHSQQHLALTLSLFGFWLPLLALWFPSTSFSRSTLNNSIEHLENVLPFFVQPLVLFIVTFHIQGSLSCFTRVTFPFSHDMQPIQTQHVSQTWVTNRHFSWNSNLISLER